MLGFQRWVVVFWAVTVCGLSCSAVAEEPALRRVKIVEHEQGKTVVRSDGELLRGASLLVYMQGLTDGLLDHLQDESFWQIMQDNGVNAIRLTCFDPWQQSHGAEGTTSAWPHVDWDNETEVATLLNAYDQVIDAATRHGMYVMVNYHNTGGYRDPDYSSAADSSTKFKYLDTFHTITKFWSLVAPRYRDRENVFYELMNEPVQWGPDKYSAETLDDIKTVYDQVRSLAPETHLVLISTANHTTYQPVEQTLVKVARELQQRGIDFANESVGFHAYNVMYPKPNRKEAIVDTMQEFAVLNTEANIPKELNETPNDPDGSGFDGDYFGVQSMERMKISWFHWKTSSPADIDKFWLGMLLPDAKEKGYYWGK